MTAASPAPAPRQRRPGGHGAPGLQAAGAGALLYPGVLGEPLEPSYPAAGTLARLAARQLAAGRRLRRGRAGLPAPA